LYVHLASTPSGVLHDGSGPLHGVDAGHQGGDDQTGLTEQLLIGPAAVNARQGVGGAREGATYIRMENQPNDESIQYLIWRTA
jgi:hypothetical protein